MLKKYFLLGIFLLFLLITQTNTQLIDNNATTSNVSLHDDVLDDDTDSDNEHETPHETPINLASPRQEPSKLKLNQTHANMFKTWIQVKSSELYDLSMNFSGFNLLNDTYNVKLRNDVKFSWINFTEMIVNISNSISQVLYNKTLVVKKLTDLVEKTYDGYVKDTDQVLNSTNHVYYDSKSPKTFCDVAESYKQKLAEKQAPKTAKENLQQTTTITTTTPSFTTTTTTTSTIKTDKSMKRSINYGLYSDDLFFTPKKFEEPLKIEYKNEIIFYPNQSIVNLNLKAKPPSNNKAPNNKGVANPNSKTRKPYKITTTTVTTTLTTPYIPMDEDEEENLEEDGEGEMGEYDLSHEYWDVQCINRTYDENFKSVQKVNRNESTIQVPINVYKQEISINMTAYWSEKLDEQFKKNYDEDNELLWQYFCSSNGLFRRYPAAYWSVNQNDFFDCRLQTWYIMAAASPKDALILLDVSGSMTGLRLEIGKKLIEFILDTFTDNDFFNILTFSNNVQYLFNDDPDYKDTFIQAGKANKLKFKQRLETYKNTSQQGRLTEPLKKVFNLFNQSDLERSGCNKVIMIITDGHADDVDHIFKKYNSDKRIRVFSFKIGRDMTDPSEIKKLACNNNGEYYHVVTLTDINEHVYEYIPVLSRPMALSGHSETTWSNVFIGYLDKELKIAVARPAFRNVKLNYSNFEIKTYMNKNIDFKVDNYEQIIKKNKNSHGLHLTDLNERDLILNAEKEIRKQQVLLGIVGVDVPVLKLISKVSPKYQMGVGIYIIVVDNNGFIVFHPSIKKEISESQFDFKGTSHSIDMDKFEIPIGNDYEFELLEHDMIDQKTGNMTLDNWKREGLRIIRRRTEYVFTSVDKTPFSVAIASPSSFGRYYIDLPAEKGKDYEEELKELVKKRFDTNIQLYNCSYSYYRLTERLTNPKQSNDFCIRYLYQDSDQALAIKSDLTLHNIYYNKYNFSMFSDYQNLVKSSFYGTYSGITFYLPVTFFRQKTINSSNSSSTTTTTTFSTTPTTSTTPETSTTILPLNSTSENSLQINQTEELEAYNMSLNLFSFDSNKHTYSFEKQYYTRSIEFTDYLRTEFNKKDEPIIIYFLNETSTGSINPTINETISAAIPIWLDKVPTVVAGVVYDSKKLQDLLFSTNCEGENCTNICSKKSDLKVSCFLVDEHGFVLMTNTEQYSAIGQPLYKVNPWLMLQLEIDGLFDLIVTGNKTQECNKPPTPFNNAATLFNLIKFIFNSFSFMFLSLSNLISNSLFILTEFREIKSQMKNQPVEINQVEWRIQNSHCYYFGIYSFNIRKWRSMDPSELKTWCNTTDGHRHYLAGYLKQSNLILLAVEEETQVSKCGSIDVLSKNRPQAWNSKLEETSANLTNRTNFKKQYSINRYPYESVKFEKQNNFQNFKKSKNFKIMKAFNIHEKSQEELINLLRRLVYHGENNSALVIGPRGSGKTFLINRVLQTFNQELKDKKCSDDLIVVYLSGCLQIDDKSALLEITRQLKLENCINGKVFGSFCDSFEFLLKSFRSGGETSKPLVFIMDEFDLFTKNKTQLLLYTLLNTIQSSSSPMFMIGATCRIDVLDLLEKRIKSRFSHRQIYLFNEFSFETYIEMAKFFIQINSKSTKTSKNTNEYLNNLFNDKNVLKFFARQYDYDRSIATLKRLLILPGLSLDNLDKENLKNMNVEPVKQELIKSYNLLNIDTKFSLLSGLSILELTLVVVMLEMSETYPDEPFNFDLVYNGYLKYLQKKNWGQQKHERQIILKAYEHLIALKFVLPSSESIGSTNRSAKINKEHSLMYLALDKEEIEKCIAQYPNCPTELKYYSMV
ncbi:unnamed protein product [Brachionus calyciflorus]|uniref:VWFA domain-containing protein n=1 Tax=Brachionus calyciflorus TaxID=104777 RepID=A0A813QJ30_9BILA|nr:unnamed protein product [Brachionus calyciflorus]